MIPENVVRELRYIEVYTAKKIRNMRPGAYTSKLRGSGFDFDQHRHYRPGDDVRTIDWNVTARMNVPYVKQTHEERELNMVIAVDVSRSMDYGSDRFSKKEVLTFITGSLLFSAISDRINAGFLGFADRVLSYHPPRAPKTSAWTLLEDLWSLKSTETQTRLLPAAEYLNRELKQMSVVFFVSDFLSNEDWRRSNELKALAAKHDVIAVVLDEPGEDLLPAGSGYLRLKDMESGKVMALGLNEKNRSAYREAFLRHREQLVEYFYASRIDHVFIRATEHFLEPLMQVFEARKNR